VRTSSSEVEDEDTWATESEGESERGYLCSNCGCDFPQFFIMHT
jgi:hypothetical protein